IANHDTGRVVDVAIGRSQAALQGFFDRLGADRCAQVRAITMDMATIWREPCARSIPQADICFDPFHLIRAANRALDLVYSETSRTQPAVNGREWRTTRYALRAGAERLDERHRSHV